MKKSLIRKYARLAVRTGINIKPGQSVVITAEADQYEFVEMVVNECYRAHAKSVRVDFSYQPLTRMKYQNESIYTLTDIPKWSVEKYRSDSEELPCMIHILSDDPDGLLGVNREKLQAVNRAKYKAIKKYRDNMENKYQWTIIAVPSVRWAEKVFPDDKTAVAVNKLWSAIFETVRLNDDTDPEKEWEKHNADFRRRCDILNSMHLDRLHYESSNGTDFTVWLIPRAKWEGGGERTLAGNFFNPNMPTEEIFTSPMAGKAEGTLVSSKPLSYNGKLIDGFSITFANGEAVEWSASEGYEALTKMIESDEGSRRIGEVALVGYDSPINKQGITYYNTLFDENACCHVALGEGFTNLIEGYENMTQKELHDAGINESMIHVDFMVGTEDMKITGFDKDGKKYGIFENGNFCF